MKAISMEQLNRIAGYIQAGEGGKVSYSQDDATRTWVVKVDNQTFCSDTLGEAFEKALAEANEYYKETYDMAPARGPD